MDSMIKKGCLLLHGFTGGPFELEPLGSYLEQHGWECRIPTLPWHGGDLSGMKKTAWLDWVAAAESEARSMQDKYGAFDLIGFSMGGIIAADLAGRFPVNKLVLLSAAAVYWSPRRFVEHLMKQLRAKNWETFRKIRRTPFTATMQFVHLTEALRPKIKRVTVPTLVLQGNKDQVVHPYSARYIQHHLAGEVTVRYFPQSRHLICLDVEAKQVFETVETFLE